MVTSTPASGTQHSLLAGAYRVEIASVGASLRLLTSHGRDLVVPFDADEIRPAYRGATLVPWPNRVVDGRYRIDGQDLQLALTEPSRAHALHGLGAWLDWRAIDVRADAVVLEATIEPQTGYPWRTSVRTTYALGPDGLTQTVVATNESSTPAPFGTGPHPYLVAGDGRVDDWTLELPADRVLHVTADRLIPTGLTDVDADDGRFDFREPRPIAATFIDHAFTGLRRDKAGTATVRLTDASGAGVQMTWDGACPWVQIHTADQPDVASPAHRVGLVVEPMTCAPDAFNKDRYPFPTGLAFIAPGSSMGAGWRISAIR